MSPPGGVALTPGSAAQMVSKRPLCSGVGSKTVTSARCAAWVRGRGRPRPLSPACPWSEAEKVSAEPRAGCGQPSPGPYPRLPVFVNTVSALLSLLWWVVAMAAGCFCATPAELRSRTEAVWSAQPKYTVYHVALAGKVCWSTGRHFHTRCVGANVCTAGFFSRGTSGYSALAALGTVFEYVQDQPSFLPGG